MSRDSSCQGSCGSFMARTGHKDILVMIIAGIQMGISAHSLLVSLPRHEAHFSVHLLPRFYPQKSCLQGPCNPESSLSREVLLAGDV